METLLNALPWIVGGLILILLLAALRRPLEWLVRLAARTGVGLAALWALSGVGGLVGLTWGSIWSTLWCSACWACPALGSC